MPVAAAWSAMPTADGVVAVPIMFANGGTWNGSLTTAEIASPAWTLSSWLAARIDVIVADNLDDVAAGIDRLEREHAGLVGVLGVDDPAEARVAQPHGDVRQLTVRRVERVALDRRERA